MPSCVVKCCRNHSGSDKKSKGITFHRFPSVNEVWRNDWIKIIRESRKEKKWNPTKSSVVCSVHFDENDLYTTKGGLLRVVSYGVPKKNLQVNDPTDSSSHQPIKSDESDDDNVEPTMSLHQISSVVDEYSDEETTSQKVSLRSSSLENKSSKILVPGKEEQPPPVLLTSRRMQKDLLRLRAVMINQKKKIKLLNQKVRRLESKNKALKEKLETRKKDNNVLIFLTD